MATTVVKTIRAAGGDFTSLSAWEATIPADLVAVDEQWVAECYNDWVTGLIDPISIVSRTTDATRNVVIRASDVNGTAGQSKNLGDPNTGFNLKSTTDWAHPINNSTEYFTGQDIIISTTALGSCIMPNSAIINTTNLILLGNKSGTSNAGIYAISSGSTILNCLSIGSTRGFSFGFYSNAILSNCVSANNDIGYADGFNLNLNITNCIGYNNTTADFDVDVSGDSNNSSSDATATGANSITGITSAEFVDAVNDDYHLSATSQLKGAGLNLIESSALTSPQYDIDGDQWPDSGAWDIGFDYYVSGAATYNYTSTGGITTSGTAIISTKKDFIATGGITTGGAADTALIPAGVVYNHTATGGIVTSGTAIVSSMKDFVASGGITTGGVAVTELVPAGTNIYNHTSIGGISTSGSADVNQLKSIISTGGIDIAGESGISSIKSISGSGGIVTGGVAETSLVPAGTSVYNHTSTGGVSTGGSADIVQIKDYQADGGFTTGGDAVTSLAPAGTNVYNHSTTNGGITTGGSAKVIQIKDYIASGGISIGGTSVTSGTNIVDFDLNDVMMVLVDEQSVMELQDDSLLMEVV